ncbi:hypothetical protein [Lysinibacillus zambalensis]|uniref:hypothetical protein n=1 Tax=Lysinibacillus zambalensis TaxID=3160866 RepID=UPI0032E42907
MRKRSANVASAKGLGFVFAKAKRQPQHEGRHDIGDFGNATGRGVFYRCRSVSLY